jgi:LytR cell envelope-related transcriptional attenuator
VSDFYAQLEEQLVAAGRRRDGQGRARRMLAGRGRRLAAAGALAVAIAAAVVVSLVPVQRDAAPRRPALPAAPAPSVQADLSGIRVAILNGTTRTGLARATAGELDARHARIASTGNAANQQLALTEVRYRRGARAKALRVAAALGVGRVGPSTSSQRNVRRADVVVLVGADRQLRAAPSLVPRVPTAPAPSVPRAPIAPAPSATVPEVPAP